MSEERIIGFLETPDGDDDITGAGVDYYEFGLATKTRGRFPYGEHEVGSYYRGSRDPTLYPVHVTYKGALSVAPVNGVLLYLAAGSSSTTTGVHTLSWLDSGELPQWVTRWEKRRTAHTIRKSMTANKVSSLSLQLLNANTRSAMPLFLGLGWHGENVIDAAYAADHDPIFPGSSNDFYRADSNMLFSYDTEGDNVDYKSDVVDIAYNMNTLNRSQKLIDQYKPYGILEGERVHQLGFTILRAGDKSIHDDNFSQNRNSSGKKINWRIYNTASNYIDITWPNCLFIDVEEPDAEPTEPELWEVSMLTGPPVIKIKDGLSEVTFYGE